MFNKKFVFLLIGLMYFCNCNSDDGDARTMNDTCTVDGQCVGFDPCELIECIPRSQCHVAGTCFRGECTNPTKPDGHVCDDENPNTVQDTCRDGICIGIDLCVNVTCTSISQCFEAGACIPKTGSCTMPVKPDGSPCDDGNPVTVDDQCFDGLCAGIDLCAGITCQQLSECHVPGLCLPATGTCTNPLVQNGTACEDRDSNECNKAECFGGSCLQSIPVEDGKPCDDGKPETINDQCFGGVCRGIDLCEGVVCEPLDQCHIPGKGCSLKTMRSPFSSPAIFYHSRFPNLYSKHFCDPS